MAYVRSRRFVGPVVLNNTGVINLYTVPVNRLALVRGLVVACITATVLAPVNVRCRIQIGGAGTHQVLWDETFTSPGTRALPGGVVALGEGDVLSASASVANVVTVTASGSLLDGDPS